jgi:putative SOS response-associated peptidase YedK
MCGRYASSHDAADIAAEFDIEQRELPDIDRDWNVAPTKETYVVVERPRREGDDGSSRRQLRVMTWGLVPFWSKDTASASRMINARMETVAEKPAYRRAFRQRRALIPADGYYEWYHSSARSAAGKAVKQPYFIRPRDGSLLAMAGLYEIWRDPAKSDDDPTRFRWTMTVITTTAEDDLGQIHERMPLMLGRDSYDDWLDPEHDDPASLLGLLEPAAPGRLLAQPVSRLVSNVQNNGPELVEPITLAGEEARHA